MTAKTFRDLGVDPTLCDALETQNITHAFPIQELTLPLALGGNDLIGQARTGTGKTLAFGLPLLQQLDPSVKQTQALVVVPTRELCVQVHDDLTIGEALGLTTVSVYGGVGYDTQIDALRSGVHVVVGTPGRLLDHLNRGNLDLSSVRVLVLDEADEMLDMGFLPDVERLIEACPAEGRHTMLFSATMPTEIVKLARRYLTSPTFTRADTEPHETAPNVDQHFFHVHRMDKPRVLARLLQAPDRRGCYVFVRTKNMADRLVDELEALGVKAVAIHGDLRQQTRERNLDRFRGGKVDTLVATEVAARGLDVEGVTHVVNYDCPDDEKMYLHRIGRTARAGAAGVAVTFAEFNEVDRLNMIRKAVGAVDTEIEQVFSTSDLLTERFELPAERPWDKLAGDDSRPRDRADRGGAGRGRDERRRGSTDGRPKSRRSAEGRRSDRDANRSRRQRDRGDSTGERGPAPKPAKDEPTATRTRTRTRARTRDREEATSDKPAGGSADKTTTDRDRSRARAKPTDRSSGGSSKKRASTDADGAGGGKSGTGRSSDGKRGDDRSRSRGSSGTKAERATQAAGGAPQPRGRQARGEGQPASARRVKVEHLP